MKRSLAIARGALVLALAAASVTLVAVSFSFAAPPPVGTVRTPERGPSTPGPTPSLAPSAQPRVVAVRAIAGRKYGDGNWPYEVDVLNPMNATVQLTIEQDAATGGMAVSVPPTSTKTVTLSSAILPLRCKTLDYPISVREYRGANDRTVRRTPSCTFKAKAPAVQDATAPTANKVSYRSVSVNTSTPACNQPFRAEMDVTNKTNHSVAIELTFGPATPPTPGTIQAGATLHMTAGLAAYAGTIHDPETASVLLSSSSSPGDIAPGGYKVEVDAECNPTWTVLP